MDNHHPAFRGSCPLPAVSAHFAAHHPAFREQRRDEEYDETLVMSAEWAMKLAPTFNRLNPPKKSETQRRNHAKKEAKRKRAAKKNRTSSRDHPQLER